MRGVAAVGIDEHVDGEEETVDGAGAVGVDEEFCDGDLAAGGERGEDFLDQGAAAGFAFAVEDVAEGRELVAGAEVCFHEVAIEEGEALGEAEAGDGLLSNRDYAGPIDGGDVDVR